MNEQLKNKWVSALRSGEYDQTSGYLKVRRGDGSLAYCCLGVLCELMELPHEEDMEGSGLMRFLDEETGLTSTGVLPGRVGEDLGLMGDDAPRVTEMGKLSKSPLARFDDPQGFLVHQNDEGVSFPKIADWIEENL